jgi:hypothetical protein
VAKRKNPSFCQDGIESLHGTSDDNGIRIVNFATSKNLSRVQCSHTATFVSTLWLLLIGNMHNQIHHILLDKRWHSIAVDIQPFTGADCDTDHYLVVAEVRERERESISK